MDRLTELRNMVTPGSGNDRENDDIIQAASRVLRGDFEEEDEGNERPQGEESKNILDELEEGLENLQHKIFSPFSKKKSSKEDVESGRFQSRQTAQLSGNGESNVLTNFYEDVDSVKALIEKLKLQTKAVSQKHRAALEDPTNATKVEEELMTETSLARELAVGIKRRLDKMKELQSKVEREKGQGCAEARIIAGTQGALAKRFMNAMREFQNVQEECENDMREQAERQLKIINPKISKTEIDTVLDATGSGGNASSEILRQQMLMARDGDYNSIRLVMEDVEERTRAMRQLEENIQELRQMFIDMSVLVESQGETIDQIESNISSAKASTKTAASQLRSARKHQKRYYRLLFCLFCCLIILLIAILVPIGVAVIRPNNGG
ncbi:Syntaxin-1A [Galdieria sulphuraria]|uniref:Syntaxin 1B/2/3 isoform 1 n=1 Tax=Galdieria sulphuraria TaxID=130081 RepID=M2XAZ6_GALSU|nr:syntaxin 1B/2/3 isoform 1 [Galdieria sulphuraria]XP_005703593.1 syntaxin 1B/2/3 isoform 2 [Galdieria sulphuraria]EME27072.1 syntaxin 1B/2/3 isoform 1 [Galdieria sulphuraria]EME27073.1 syntaxin 1B/2/3 isoform 2 [Galdieria sulphuraria]GJD05628.1 Syntaxin-1A [Galdieria sulphuraria]|eukprot:XP_005703592.1 syntaxin 1B/2/3 isoform 1 [Galdieria sulphuraria]